MTAAAVNFGLSNSAAYAGNSVVPFYVDVRYDNVKVMAWERISSLKPMCSTSRANLASNEISMFMIE